MKFTVEKAFEVCSQLSQNPSVGRVEGGDLLLLHTNTGDCMAGCRMFLRRSTDGGATWSEPERTIQSAGAGLGPADDDCSTMIAFLMKSSLGNWALRKALPWS